MKVSAQQVKNVVALKQKKYRDLHREFLVEGRKTIADVLEMGMKPVFIVTSNLVEAEMIPQLVSQEIWECSYRDMQKMSNMVSPPGLLAIFEQPKPKLASDLPNDRWILALDDVRDPGNLGTIIRTAHWFGVRDLLLAGNCAEVFNSKTVQATMGSIAAMTYYEDSYENILSVAKGQQLKTWIADSQGQELGQITFGSEPGMIVLGSESHGLSPHWNELAATRLHISPAHSGYRPESLNVAVAAGILLAHLSSSQ
jgi:RNA methyltransferase, TrmH family